MHHQPYSSRRQQVLARLGDGVAVIPTAPSGCATATPTPIASTATSGTSAAFPNPRQSSCWSAARKRSRSFSAAKRTRSAKSGTVSAMDRKPPPRPSALPKRIRSPVSNRSCPNCSPTASLLWHSLGHDADWDRRIAAALNAVRADSRSGARAPAEIRDLHRLLDQMRLTKDAHEIDLMRRAADIASAGHAAPCAPADRAWPNTNSKPN
jgi:Xaa-Pro aminopeptidase